MINKVATPVEQGFVKAYTNLAGTVNEKLVPRSVDLLEQFLATSNPQRVKSGIEELGLFDAVKSYALSHGQKLDIVG